MFKTRNCKTGFWSALESSVQLTCLWGIYFSFRANVGQRVELEKDLVYNYFNVGPGLAEPAPNTLRYLEEISIQVAKLVFKDTLLCKGYRHAGTNLDLTIVQQIRCSQKL